MICLILSELDLHCITERIAAMSYPADGIDAAFKNHIDDISATIESRHSNKVSFVTFYNNPLSLIKLELFLVRSEI